MKLGSTRRSTQFKAAAITTEHRRGEAENAVFVGGPNDAAPGKSTTATVKLDPGLYAVACFIPGTDGKPHAAHGMIGQVQVAMPDESVNVAPVADSDDHPRRLLVHAAGRVHRQGRGRRLEPGHRRCTS